MRTGKSAAAGTSRKRTRCEWGTSPSESAGAQAVDLGPAGDAGFDLVAQHVAFDEFAVLLVVGNGVRARANDAHAALQYIDKLRQFVG